MAGFLFHDIIFGPVRSRRLGLSLGINLLPIHTKYCSFNCIYCECGWSTVDFDSEVEYPSRALVYSFLENKLMDLKKEDYLPDTLTFAGNGEPTLHPEFESIIHDTIELRDRLSPQTKVSVLSNATRLDRPSVFNALMNVDNNILKLDAGSDRVFNLMNNPAEPISVNQIVENLKRFNGNLIIQSMFLKGRYKGETIDNTLPQEVEQWLHSIQAIRPKMVMLYPIARATPVHELEKIEMNQLETIAEQVRALGIQATVYP